MSSFKKCGLVATLLAARTVLAGSKPTYPYDPNTTPNCVWWVDHDGFDTCQAIVDDNWITVDEFRQMNPSVGAGCTGLKVGQSYCVEKGAGPDPQPITTSSSSTKSTTSTPTSTTFSTSTKPTTTPSPTPSPTKPSNGISTPEPTQPNMVDNCDAFYFVKPGEGCSDVLTKNGITLAQLFQWNPSVGANCAGLWSEVNVCVSIIGHTPSTTTPGNGIATPQPTQPNMVNNCDAFYFVKPGESCNDVLTKNSITLAQLYQWNPSVGSNCAGLWVEVNVCVSIVGHTPTTTQPGNGIATPTPVHPSMVPNCDAFYKVQQGENCNTVASKNGITLAELIKFNPNAGTTTNCNGLWADTYACVSIIGHTPTQPGNGVQTPSPTQGGMVSNCKTFHFVDGQTCQAVLDRYKITLANFAKWNTQVGSNCQNMWNKTWYCVATL
jgi:LysM repeat protein